MKDFSKVKFKWTFRDYQQAVLDNSRIHLKDKKIHIVAAPGSGKTILGLELVRRQNAPTLIMSPSVTIRQQWGERFIEAYLPESENPDEYISYSLKNPKLITSITYQALHAAFTKSAIEEEADDDLLFAEESQDYSSFDLLSEIRKAGIKTICLDEAHHLKSEWQKALEKFVELLGTDVTIIALTATPPYDSTPAEWNRYNTLCGDIDEEIFVPQLVVQKTLCPHQDYIYFSYPTEEETEILKNYKQKAESVSEEIIKSGFLSEALKASGVSSDEVLLYDNLESFKALVISAQRGGLNISKSLEEKVSEGRKLPGYTLSYAEKAFQFIIDNPDIFTEELSEKLKSALSKEALIEKRKVRLVSSDKINKMLISSTGKLDSIGTIVRSEYANLGDSLRMLILTDYIKKDMMKLVGTDEEIHALGTVPVFEAIRRNIPEAKAAVLTGTLVILPDSAVETVQEIAYNEGVHCKIKKLENTNHTEIIFSGSNKNKVNIITKAFQVGVINVLVGTKSLLGEGWDSPNINSLILASFVGSFMLSNQMRGRAIRIDKNTPDKVSNIWHLVTVLPDDDTKGSNEIEGEDFLTIKRRFSCFQAPAYNKNVIESGIRRIDILTPPFDSNGIDRINSEMLRISSDRKTAAERWSFEIKSSSSSVINDASEIPMEVYPKKKVSSNMLFKANNKVVIVCAALLVILCSGHAFQTMFPVVSRLIIPAAAIASVSILP